MPKHHSSREMFDLDDCRCKTVSGKAILIITEDGEEVWIPKSQIDSISRGGKDFEPTPLADETFTVRMTAWIAKEKGFR